MVSRRAFNIYQVFDHPELRDTAYMYRRFLALTLFFQRNNLLGNEIRMSSPKKTISYSTIAPAT